jgi:glucosamine-6-phosphate deaminase
MTGSLKVETFADRKALGSAAAHEIATELRSVLTAKGSARVIFAAAPSQAETLTALAAEPDIDWGLVTAFHLDEYIGLTSDAPQGFGNWLRAAIFDRLAFAEVNYIRVGWDPVVAASDYATLLSAAPIDIVCLGIGMNGHLAFNDPPVADFADPLDVKVVELDETCRRQQVEDDCFRELADVPRSAITVTIPALLAARRLFCVVPGALKAEAVRATLTEPIDTAWPSTILRTHPACTLYLDSDSASLVEAT